jgi:hypothetical protein
MRTDMKYFLFIFAFVFASCSVNRLDEKEEYSLIESEYGETYIPSKNWGKFDKYVHTVMSTSVIQFGVTENIVPFFEATQREAYKLYSIRTMDLCIIQPFGRCERVIYLNTQQAITQDSLRKIYEESVVR